MLRRTLALILVIGATVCTSNSAEARRGIAILNTGQDLFEAGPLPGSLQKVPELSGWQAGYRCSIFGLFWVYATWWDCKPVAFKGDTYNEAPAIAAAVAKAYSPSDIKPGFWKGYMRWLLLALLVIFGGLGIWGLLSKDEDEPIEASAT